MRSRGASLAPSRAASRVVSRATSPVLSATSATAADDPALPLVLCNLLQQEFSGTHSPGKLSGSSFKRRTRRGEQEQEDDDGG